LASFYGLPHKKLYDDSAKTYISVQHNRDTDVRVIPVKDIDSVVMMAPDKGYGMFYHDGTEANRWFLMEKPGLKMSSMVGLHEEIA
jgi:hypothetical protein